MSFDRYRQVESDGEDEFNQQMEVEQPKAPPLEIPIRDDQKHETSEVIAFDPFELPPCEDVIEVLIDQEATQMRWLRFAAAYFRASRAKETEKILVVLKGEYTPYKPGMPQPIKKRGEHDFNPDKLYANDQEGRALVGNALAALYLHFAREHRQNTRQSAEQPEVEKPIAILGNDNRLEQFNAQQLLARAEAILGTADKHSKTERVASITSATKGEIQMEQYLWRLTKTTMSQSEIDKTLNTINQSFQTSLDLRPQGMRAMFGKAAILFLKAQFKEARDLYARAISRYPGADPGPTRVALGLCYYELGQEGRAQECFERALELDPKSVDAQVCLAIIEMGLATDAERAVGATAQELARNQETARKLREKANERLRIAYDLDKWNPLLKVHLANNFFYSPTRDYKRISDLAKEAFNHTTSKYIKAEACYISARNLHDQGNTKDAAQLYSKGLDFWAMFPLARFGHAQMELTQSRPDLGAALRALQLVIESPEGKDDEDSLLMLGALHAKMNNVDAALQALRRVTEKNPYRSEAWLQQALLEQAKYRQSVASAEEAIRCYDKAIGALKFNREAVPYELYNNVGSLKFRVGDYKGSLAAFDSAIKEKGGNIFEEPNHIKLQMVTLAYNRARALEGLGRFDDAERAYNQLMDLSKYHTGEVHVDAQLRLAALSADRGDFETAIETYIKPLSTSLPKNVVGDFYCFYGGVEIARARMNEASSAKAWAESKFKRVIDQNLWDPYARLANANLFLEEAQSLSHRKEDRAKGDNLMKEAASSYRSILHRNPTNVFAANGLGAYHAARGRYQTAQMILEKVREFSDSICPSAWINLAHVHVHEGAFEQAASLYDQCLKRFFDNRDAEVSLYLANARFQAGKYTEARLTLLNALKYSPSDENLWFASANVDEAEAYQKLSLDPKLRTAAGVENSLKCLKRALDIYDWMISKSLALTKSKTDKKGDSGQQASAAKRAYEETQSPLQVPQRPAAPMVQANGFKISRPSAALIARARVAQAEILGREPSASDAAAVRRADTLRLAAEQQEKEKWRALGRRPNIERALAMSSTKQVSATAVNRLAQLASKRAEIVQEEIKRSQLYLETQKKLERKLEADRKRVEELRLAEIRRIEEEAKKHEELERKKEEQMLERKAELARRNEELARRFREEEEAEAMKGARRSGRERKKSRKMQESEQVQIKRRKKKSSSQESSDEDESEDEDEDEEEEVEDEESYDSDAEQKEEEEDNAKNEEERKLADELRRLLDEEPDSVQKGVKWFQQKCKETLGEDVVGKIDSKRFKKMLLRVATQEPADVKPKAKRLKTVEDDDVFEGDEDEKPIERKVQAPPKKKSKVVEESSSEDDDEDDNDELEPAGADNISGEPVNSQEKASPTVAQLDEEEEL
jgi:tetratricopeptide (TPR) repeat protein